MASLVNHREDMMEQNKKLWLWRNGDHFLAFDNPYPTYDGGDPMTLGEPVGFAIFIPSTEGDGEEKTGLIE